MAYRLSITDRISAGPPSGRGGRVPAPAAARETAAGSSSSHSSQQEAEGGLSVEHHWLALGSCFNGRVQRPHLYPRLEATGASGSMRIVLGDPPEATTRLRNRKEMAAAAPGGCILLLKRGGGSSFADKAWRALQACPDLAAVVVGNDDRQHPHALFSMPGAWPPRSPAPIPTAAASAAAAATAKVSSSGGGSGGSGGSGGLEAPPVPVVMISCAAYEQVLGLLRLEAELDDRDGMADAGGWLFSLPSTSRFRLHVRLEPLVASSVGSPQLLLRLSSFEMGPAIRQAVRANDHMLLRALLDQIPDEEDEESELPPLAYTEAEAHTGQTVLHLAIEAGALECLTPLLQRPGIARILDVANSRGRRPVHLASEQPGRDLALRLLLAAGAYIDAPDEVLGWTPLHFAVRAGALEAIAVLVQAGATLDARGMDGSTPFIVALHCGNCASAEALLAAGANPHLPNLRGKRPADCRQSGECARLLARYEQQAVSSGRPIPGGRADFFHWSAAPWLSTLGGQYAVVGEEVAGVRMVCFSAGVAMPRLLDGMEEGSSSSGGGSVCRAVLPASVLRVSLREEAERWQGQQAPEAARTGDEEEEETLRHHLRALAQSAPDPTAAVIRTIARAARAAWAAGLPPLGTRGRLVMVELPRDCRRALWLGALTGQGEEGEVGPGAVEEGWLCQGSPVRSTVIEGRVRCLFEDLRRTRIPAYCSGPGMDRVRRLVLLWLRSDEANDYRQGLTFMACPILETFTPGPEPALGWDPVSDGQALLCLSRLLDLHAGGLFVHGNSLDQLQRRIALLEALVMYHDPATAAHLAGCGVGGALYLSRWLITLFSDVLPLARTAALWDVLFTLGRGLLPCFAAALVLGHRDALLATATQTGALLFFSQLNSSADLDARGLGLNTTTTTIPRIDVPACLARALALYVTTPAALLRAWDEDDAAPRRRTTSDVDSSCLPPLVEPPVVLERPPEVTAGDLVEMVACEAQQRVKAAEAHAAAAAAVAGPTAAGGEGLVEPERALGVLLLDVRDLTLEDHRSGEEEGEGATMPMLDGVPPGCPRLRLPWTRIRGHVGFCQGLRTVQQEMRPPRALQPYVGKAHVVVYAGQSAGAKKRARAVARMLVLSRVPYVSVYTPPPVANL